MSQNQELMNADSEYSNRTASLDIIDKTNPKAVINLVDDKMVSCITAAYAARPDLFELEPSKLEGELKRGGFSNSPALNRIRIKFWDLYDYASIANTVMIRSSQFHNGVCTAKVFWKLMDSPEAVAWLMTPPASYQSLMEEALNYGLEQMRAILELPHFDKKGQPNTRLLDIKMKITQMLDMRKHGSFLQRSEQKNLNLHVTSKTEKIVEGLSIQSSVMKLEEKLKELRERDNANLTFVEHTILETSKEDGVIDVTINDEHKGNGRADEAPGPVTSGPSEIESSRTGELPFSFGEEGTS